MDKQQKQNLLRAQKRIGEIKKFYRHLKVYIIVNVLLLVVKLNLFNWFKNDYEWLRSAQFNDWMGWNFLGTPVLWGLGLLAHGLYIFKLKYMSWNELKPDFIREWEKRQLDKFLKEENDK